MKRRMIIKREDKIRGHFKNVDPVISSVISRMEFELLEVFLPPSEYFGRLCREIISQQLASKAAGAIVERFLSAFPEQKVTPQGVLALSENKLRSIGMSWAKARSVRDLAAKSLAGDIAFERFPQADDEAVITELTKVRGIGRWTAEMFLIFTLGREDIFSFGDLGLKKSLISLYGRSRGESKRSVERITKRWSPYRSYASLALWELADKPKFIP